MARRAIDVVAGGPPSPDLFDPSAPAWALAGGLAARGHSVLVTFPGSAASPPAPDGVTVAPFSPVTAHVGTYLGDAELARSAARHLRPAAEVVVRDPSGLGSLGHHASHRAIVSFVRSFAVDTVDAGPAGTAAERRRPKVFAWGERRGVRRLEKEALGEATTVCCATAAQRERLHDDYGIAPERLRVAPLAVARAPEVPAREAARRLLTVPDDVLLLAVLPPADPANADAVRPALEGFRRTRPIFPGARLVVIGVPEPGGPGIVTVPSRDAAGVASAVVAADVAVAPAPGPAGDPGLVLALRAGVPVVVGASIDLGEGSGPVVRRADTADSGELASVLVELFADPEERHALGESSREFARRFEPEQLAGELEGSGALGAA